MLGIMSQADLREQIHGKRVADLGGLLIGTPRKGNLPLGHGRGDPLLIKPAQDRGQGFLDIAD